MALREAIRFAALQDWMARNDYSLRRLALEAQIDKMTLSRLLRGHVKRFNPDVVSRISSVTREEVGEREFVAFFRETADRRREEAQAA